MPHFLPSVKTSFIKLNQEEKIASYGIGTFQIVSIMRMRLTDSALYFGLKDHYHHQSVMDLLSSLAIPLVLFFRSFKMTPEIGISETSGE